MTATQPVIWKRQSPELWQLCSEQRNGKGIGETESFSFHLYMVCKLFNNANPSEVNEASQADSAVYVYENLGGSKTLLDRGLRLLNEFLKRAVGSLIPTFKNAKGSIFNTD